MQGLTRSGGRHPDGRRGRRLEVTQLWCNECGEGGKLGVALGVVREEAGVRAERERCQWREGDHRWASI